LLELLSRIDHIEVNLDRAIGIVAGEPRRTTNFGESIRKLVLIRIDILGGGVATARTTTNVGRASKGDGDEREEDSESDGEVKNHGKWKMTNEDDRKEGSGCIVTTCDVQGSKEGWWGW